MFEIGTIVKAQGIRGEVRVFPTTDDPSRFNLLVGKDISLRQGGMEKAYKLLQARLHKNIVIVKLEGVTDRNMAETLVGATIAIPDDMALPLEEGEYYVRDLIGLAVEDECGEHLGVIGKVLHTNANDVYVIEAAEGDHFMIPAIKSVILHVSLADKKMKIHLMDGLRELKA
ncbi:MAG: ribosome maturation factor RimM [Defluviitaleaceae bacterium]|nr:ribosome maturation factor RimM [Defluviitaleaceae bacterium]